MEEADLESMGIANKKHRRLMLRHMDAYKRFSSVEGNSSYSAIQVA